MRCGKKLRRRRRENLKTAKMVKSAIKSGAATIPKSFAQTASGPHGRGQIKSMPALTAAIAAGNTPDTVSIPPCSDSLPSTSASFTAWADTVPKATSRPSTMGKS